MRRWFAVLCFGQLVVSVDHLLQFFDGRVCIGSSFGERSVDVVQSVYSDSSAAFLELFVESGLIALQGRNRRAGFAGLLRELANRIGGLVSSVFQLRIRELVYRRCENRRLSARLRMRDYRTAEYWRQPGLQSQRYPLAHPTRSIARHQPCRRGWLMRQPFQRQLLLGSTRHSLPHMPRLLQCAVRKPSVPLSRRLR